MTQGSCEYRHCISLKSPFAIDASKGEIDVRERNFLLVLRVRRKIPVKRFHRFPQPFGLSLPLKALDGLSSFGLVRENFLLDFLGNELFEQFSDLALIDQINDASSSHLNFLLDLRRNLSEIPIRIAGFR